MNDTLTLTTATILSGMMQRSNKGFDALEGLIPQCMELAQKVMDAAGIKDLEARAATTADSLGANDDESEWNLRNGSTVHFTKDGPDEVFSAASEDAPKKVKKKVKRAGKSSGKGVK